MFSLQDLTTIRQFPRERSGIAVEYIAFASQQESNVPLPDAACDPLAKLSSLPTLDICKSI